MPKISRKKSVKKSSPKKSRAPRKAPISTRVGSCKPGYIRRKGYSFTRKNGTRVTVKSSCIKEKGRKGPTRGGSVKRRVIKISHPGSLKDLGYNLSESTSLRDAALKKILKKYGFPSSIRKLNAIATLFKTTQPRYYTKLQRDMNYIRKLDGRV